MTTKTIARYHFTYYRGWFGKHARRRCPHSDLVITGTRQRLWCRGCRRHIDGPSSLPTSRIEETREP